MKRRGKKSNFISGSHGLSSERMRSGEKLLRSGTLLSCERREDGIVEALFSDPADGSLIRASSRADGTGAECSCGSPGSCAHVSALIVHAAKFAELPSGSPLPGGKPGYGALLSRDKDALLAESRMGERDSCLKIFLDEGFPHLPAKWSLLKMNVEIVSGARSYKGSIGNLRQIHAKGTLGGLLADNIFTLQERQIIRYLSYNAEYEDSMLLLNSEKASDFFHCLPGFDNVFCGSSRISFLGEPCSLAAGLLSSPSGARIVPLLKTRTSCLNIESASFVIGQNGAWTGVSGTYFWVPGTKDVKWMRDFVRYGRKFATSGELDAELAKFKASGIEIIPGAEIAKTRKGEPPHAVLLAKFAEKQAVSLTLLFRYAGGIFPADFSPAAFGGTTITERDTSAEMSFARRILFAGFKEDAKRTGVYISSSRELATLFLGRLAPKWRSDMEIYVDGGGSIAFPGSAAREARIETRLVSSDAESFTISCRARSGDDTLPMDEVLKACEGNSPFVELAGGGLVEIPPSLSRFLLAAKDMLKTSSGDSIRLSKAQALAWDSLSDGCDDAKVQKISEFSGIISRPGVPVEVPKGFSASLRQYQKDGLAWMMSRFENGLNCLLADEMGLGKTVQAICAALLLKEGRKGENFKALVLCPSSLTENWQMELAKFAPGLKTLLLHGAGRGDKWKEAERVDVVISSYSTFKRDLERHMPMGYGLLVLDEAQHIKNPETGNARSCKKIAAAHKLVLTGTPVENAPVELWSIVDFLHPGILGTHNSFKKQFQNGNMEEALKRFSLRVSPLMLRRRKAQVLPQLPPKTEQMLYCEMDDLQGAAYSEMLRKSRERLGELRGGGARPGSKFEVLTLLLRLRQFCCHPSLLPDEFGTKDLPSAKTELLKELILEAGDSGQKTLVFSQFPSLLKIIAGWMASRGADFEYLDGSTSNRMDRVGRFNSDSRCGVFLLSIKAGGFGLNLSSAERVIIYDPWWNPAVERQAADRAHRIGQTKPVTVQKLIVKNSIEEKILLLQERKKIYFNKLVEGAPSVFRDLSMDEIKALFQ